MYLRENLYPVKLFRPAIPSSISVIYLWLTDIDPSEPLCLIIFFRCLFAKIMQPLASVLLVCIAQGLGRKL